MTAQRTAGRHRLGTPGLVPCRQHDRVDAALGRRRPRWLSLVRTPALILVPARHSLAGLRRSAAAATTASTAAEPAWNQVATT